jgi:hypothetical protein
MRTKEARHRIAGGNLTGRLYNTEHAAPEPGTRILPDHRALQPFLEAVNEATGSSQASQFDDSRAAYSQSRPKRKARQVQTFRRHVFAQVAGAHDKTHRCQFGEKFGGHQVNLPNIEKFRRLCREISMPDESARVGVAFDAMIFDELYCALDWFTETVLRVRSDGNEARFVSELDHEFRLSGRARWPQATRSLA